MFNGIFTLQSDPFQIWGTPRSKTPLNSSFDKYPKTIIFFCPPSEGEPTASASTPLEMSVPIQTTTFHFYLIDPKTQLWPYQAFKNIHWPPIFFHSFRQNSNRNLQLSTLLPRHLIISRRLRSSES